MIAEMETHEKLEYFCCSIVLVNSNQHLCLLHKTDEKLTPDSKMSFLCPSPKSTKFEPI
jgi:hypothetical protein